MRGVGLRGAAPAAIDVGNAGTLLRLLPGWLAGQPGGEWTLDGDESIRRRPVEAQLLQEVWGYDFFGGTRTVDVHVRRLRAKLGPEHESMIATVRGVGYKLLPADQARAEREAARQAGQ